VSDFISLFAGIGGLDLAAEALGYTCTAQVEWDAHCTRILERHWPDVPRWGDVHDFTAAAYADRQRLVGIGASASGAIGSEPRRHDALGLGDESVGLIVGGFPCQPVSTAGRRKAGHDARWLWPEFARVVGELRPRAVLIENVRGLLSAGHVDAATSEPVRGSAFGEVLGDLADLGYDATWTLLRASDVGACHQRARIFILATDTRDRHDPERAWSPRREAWERSAVGSEPRRPARHPDDGGHDPALRPPHLTGPEAEGAPGAEPRGAGRGRATAAIHGATGRAGFPWGAYEPAIRRWEAMTRCAPHPVDEKGRLAPPFVEWMMGFPEGWIDGMTRTQALKALGNAVVPQQAVAAMQVLATLARSEAA
jgi:DNA (cytosine-5)-methyltransferase 1